MGITPRPQVVQQVRQVVIPLEMLDAVDVAKILGMSETWVRQRTRADEIPCVRLGGKIKYRESDIQKYIDARLSGAQQ